MTDTAKRFYCDESLTSRDKDKLDYLLTYAFEHADHVEFNILSSSEKPDELIETLKSDLVARGQRFDKIYFNVEFVRFSLSDKVKEFVSSKGIKGWLDTAFEDISFLKNGIEFLATVSHENYVILEMTETERRFLNDMGFNFIYDYGTDPREIVGPDENAR